MRYEIPEKMKAVQIDKETGKLVVREVSVPKPGKGEVLVKIAAAPINPSDINRIKSMIESGNLDSFIPGIEGSGMVVGAGKGIIPAFFLGKRVGCTSINENSGTFAEYLLTRATLCFPLPKNVSDEQGSMLLVNPMTALAFFDIVKKSRQSAIISTAAAGALGRMIEFLSKKYDVRVINIVRKDEQLKHLEKSGSEYVLDSSVDGFPEKLKVLAQKLNAGIAFDAVGGKQSSTLINALPYGGSLIIYGSLSGEPIEINNRDLIAGHKSISGFYLGNWSKESGLFKTVRNVLRVQAMLKKEIIISVQSRYPLDKAQEALDKYIGNMTAGKVLLLPSAQE